MQKAVFEIRAVCVLNQAFTVDSSFSHFPFRINLICVARARRVAHTPVMTHCIHPPLFLEGPALKESPLPLPGQKWRGHLHRWAPVSARTSQMRGSQKLFLKPHHSCDLPFDP